MVNMRKKVTQFNYLSRQYVFSFHEGVVMCSLSMKPCHRLAEIELHAKMRLQSRVVPSRVWLSPWLMQKLIITAQRGQMAPKGATLSSADPGQLCSRYPFSI